MADMKITEYNSHNAPATGDQFFMIGTSEEYRIDYDALASAILDKLTTKTYSGISNNVIDAIAALNSSMVDIPSNGNKRLLYVFDVDCNLLTQEWVLGGGNNFPSGERFWYIHSIAYVTDSDGTITIGKQIAYAYSSDISYERLCKNSTWSDWVQTPSRSEVDALNSRLNGYVTIENFTITIGQCKPGVDYRQSVSVSKEGYRPFGIIGYDVLGTYGSWFQVTKLGIVDWNTATVVLRAPAGEFTTDNTAVKITVLYQKNITS